MSIDLKWLLPFAGPFVIIAQLRAVAWAAGLVSAPPQPAALLAFLIGTIGGLIMALVLHDRGIKWTIRIGKRDNG